MLYDCKRISYRIDLRLSGLAGPDYDATISFGLPFEPEDSQYGEYRLRNARRRWVQGFRTGRAWLAVPITAASMYVLWDWAFGLGSYQGSQTQIRNGSRYYAVTTLAEGKQAPLKQGLRKSYVKRDGETVRQ